VKNMENIDEQSNAPFPWRFIVAFFICVALTGLAVLITVGLHMPQIVTIMIVLAMALIQVILQLTLLLNSTFHDERWMRLASMLGGLFIAIVVIAFTFLVMSFQRGVS
jgi:heme/copper-type cytochrome/quinol oxidase subunit 4